MKGRILASLFALPFFGVGVFMLYSIASTLADAYRMTDWVPVQATLERAGYETRRGDGSDTHEAYAVYRYEFNLQSFTGDRVTISPGGDNIGSYHEALGGELGARLASGKPVTVWVNPDDPAQSIVDRTLRWGLIGFKSIFVVVFGGVGLGLLVATWRSTKHDDPADMRYADAPWLRNDDWRTGAIRSDSQNAMWAAWLFAGLWSAISAPMPFIAFEEVVDKGNTIAVVALLFPLVGVGLLVWAVRKTLEWRRLGRTPVMLDPFPGSIGGHVGGTIDVPVTYSSSVPFYVTLTNLHSYVSGGGKDRSRREKALWQDELVAHSEAASAGTRITFRFDVPEGLDESDAEPGSDSYTLWRLNLRADVPGANIDRDFEIPVYRTGESSRRISDRSVAASRVSSDSANELAIRERVRVSFDGLGKKIVYPMGSNVLPNAAALLVGATFAFAGWWIAIEKEQALFGAIFGGSGVLVAVLAFYMMFKSLEVTKQGNTIRSVRRVLGIPISRREMQVGQIYRLEKDSALQNQSGGRHTMFYRITAIDRDANEILLGEGFRGESGARAGEIFLMRELGLV